MDLNAMLMPAVLAVLLALIGLERLLRSRSWPWLVASSGFARSMLPVVLLIFGGRAFAYEPMRVPSGSMTPTLLTGDFILVDKHAYGLRNPFGNQRLAGAGAPQRGDVVVFRYPGNRSQRYVKRVVGLPGDVVEVRVREEDMADDGLLLRAADEADGTSIEGDHAVEDAGRQVLAVATTGAVGGQQRQFHV